MVQPGFFVHYQGMPTLETALRLVVIGQELLIAAVFLFGKGNRAARISGALFLLSVVGYLYASDDALGGSVLLIDAIAVLLAIAVPFTLWLFARAVFGANWPRTAIVYLIVITGALVWMMHLAGDSVEPGLANAMGLILRVIALAVVIHALWLTLRDRPDDLIEVRRSFRLFFVGIISVQVAAVLVVELALRGAPAPPWLDLTNVVVIAVLTLCLAIPMLNLNTAFFELERDSGAKEPRQSTETLSGVEGVYHKKLLELMESGFFRTTGLTISVLAKELDYPEHQLRRLINGQLGYRNFSTFLNHYRINAAKQQLADPEYARTPVLTMALDLGYGSLRPFNRAFKETTGMTPTEFRQQELSRVGADPE